MASTRCAMVFRLRSVLRREHSFNIRNQSKQRLPQGILIGENARISIAGSTNILIMIGVVSLRKTDGGVRRAAEWRGDRNHHHLLYPGPGRAYQISRLFSLRSESMRLAEAAARPGRSFRAPWTGVRSDC
jgi:hypothetical protein